MNGHLANQMSVVVFVVVVVFCLFLFVCWLWLIFPCFFVLGALFPSPDSSAPDSGI